MGKVEDKGIAPEEVKQLEERLEELDASSKAPAQLKKQLSKAEMADTMRRYKRELKERVEMLTLEATELEMIYKIGQLRQALGMVSGETDNKKEEKKEETTSKKDLTLVK